MAFISCYRHGNGAADGTDHALMEHRQLQIVFQNARTSPMRFFEPSTFHRIYLVAEDTLISVENRLTLPAVVFCTLK